MYFTSKGNGIIWRFKDDGMTVSAIEPWVTNRAYTITYDGGVQNENFGTGIDNLAFDNEGNLWAQQDGGRAHLWVIRPDHTPANPKVELFMTTPAGSESTGLTFSPDFRYGFLSIQHPSGSNALIIKDAAGNDVRFNTHSTLVFSRKEYLGADAVEPVFELGENRILCHGDSLVLTAYTGSDAVVTWNGTTLSETITDSILTVTKPGTYYATAQGNNGRLYTDTLTILADTIIPMVMAKNITVQLNSSGLAVVSSADVNNGSYDNCSFTLSLNKTSFTCADIGNNTVILTGTDGSGNRSSDTAVVTILDNPAILALSLNSPTVISDFNTSCNVEGDGSIELSISGGQAPYSVQWNTGASTNSLSGLLSGTYSVMVTDVNACERSDSISLTRPVDCGCNPEFTIPTISSLGCNKTLDGVSNPILDGGTSCIYGSFNGNINFHSGTLVIAGNAELSSLNLNSNCKVIILGTLKVGSINLNSTSAFVVNYGSVTVGNSNLGGEIMNYGEFMVTENLNVNSQGKIINYRNLKVSNNLMNNSRIENYGHLSAGGEFNNNGGSILLNLCTIEADRLTVNGNASFTNSGTIYSDHEVRLNSVTFSMSPGAILTTPDFVSNSSQVTNSGMGCALISVKNTTRLNNTSFIGSVIYCDAYNGLETSNQTKFVGGAELSCTNCKYAGDLSGNKSSRMAALDFNNRDEASNQLLSVYPNPAEGGNVVISLPGKAFFYKVYTLQGVIVGGGQSISSEGRFSLSRMESGIYLVEAEDQNGRKYHKKLLVK